MTTYSRIFAATFAMLLMASCAALDPNAARGHGVIGQNPDGSQTFRWAIQSAAFTGLIPADQEEPQRMMMLSQWLGREQACPNGYEITSRTEQMATIVYEGVCT
mgnify:CR=1 FL=1